MMDRRPTYPIPPSSQGSRKPSSRSWSCTSRAEGCGAELSYSWRQVAGFVCPGRILTEELATGRTVYTTHWWPWSTS
jgi:hypothetical protein